MSILFGAIAGGLAGAGAAGEKALGRMQEHEQQKSLEELRAELMFEKQKRLAELTHSQNVDMERNVRQPHAEKIQRADHTFRKEEAAAKREHDTQLLGIKMQDEWARINAQLKESALDRASRERVANAQIAASKSVIQTDSTGNLYRVDMNTGKATPVVNAITGEALVAKTDLSASQLKIIGLQESWAKAVLENQTSTPEERAAATKMLTEALPRALSREGPSPTDAAIAKLVENKGSAAALAEWDKVWKKHGFPAEVMLAFAATAEKNKPAAAAGNKPDATPGAPEKKLPPPIPADAPPGIVQSAISGERAAEERRAAEARKAEEEKAAKVERQSAVEWLTPERISGFSREQAMEYRNRYWDVLTSEQRRALTRRAQ